MSKVPTYSDFSLVELYQTLNSLDAKTYPQTYTALDAEIRSRSGASYLELRECRASLAHKNSPDHSERLNRLLAEALEREGDAAYGNDVAEKYHTFWRRVWAAILDALLFFIPALVAAILLPMFGVAPEQVAENIQIVMNSTWVVYSVVFHALLGQTIGKIIAGVKVVTAEDETDISWLHAILRDIAPIVAFVALWTHFVAINIIPGNAALAQLVSMLLMLVALSPIWNAAEIVTMLLNRKRRAIHDFIAGTVVIRYDR